MPVLVARCQNHHRTWMVVLVDVVFAVDVGNVVVGVVLLVVGVLLVKVVGEVKELVVVVVVVDMEGEVEGGNLDIPAVGMQAQHRHL